MSKRPAYSFHKQKLNSNVVEVILTVLGAVTTGVILLAGIEERMLSVCILGGTTFAASLFGFFYYISYSVTSERDGIRVRLFFYRDIFYPYQSFNGYRQNRHYTFLYPQNGKPIRLKNEDCDETRLKRVLARMKLRGTAKPRSGVSSSRLFWGNCSRPVQLTVFLVLLSLVFLLFLGMSLLLFFAETVGENLTEYTVTVAHSEIDFETEDLWLTDTNGNRYYIHSDMTSYLPDSLAGEELRILVQDDGEICDLRYRYNAKAVYTLADYNNEIRASLLAFAIVCAVVSPIPVVMLILALITYRDPQKHPKLYEHFETTNYWGRH